MPVDFLTLDQERRYGHFAGDPSLAQLDRFFHLDDRDHAFLARRKTPHSQVGCALQLGTVRFLGTFLDDPIEVPACVVDYIAAQLPGSTPSTLAQYRTGSLHWEHAQDIRTAYGYHTFTDQPVSFQFVRWLYTRAWFSAERPSLMFDLATAWLVEHKVLLPGVTTLTRLVAQVRDRTSARLWTRLAALPDATTRTRLESLLIPQDRRGQTPLDRLRRPPTRVSAAGLVGALRRLDDIRALGVAQAALGFLPLGRVNVLARYAAAARAQAVARMPPDRRLATLFAFAVVYEATAQDDALDLLDQVTTLVLARATRTGQQERLRTLKDLDAAALQLHHACHILLDPACQDADVRATIFADIPRDRLSAALARVAELARPPDDHYYDELVGRYSQVRQFVPTLLRTITVQGVPAARPLLDALAFLAALDGPTRPKLHLAPTAIVNHAWQRFALDSGQVVDQCYYTFCVLERLQAHLQRHDVFVTPSERWSDPRARLLQGAAWETARPQVCRILNRSTDAAAELTALSTQLDAAYHQTADNLAANPAVEVVLEDNKPSLKLTGLDKLEESPGLLALRETVAALLPESDLPDMLLEVARWTKFTSAFTHISDADARVEDLEVSLCAVLIAEACNIGLEPLVQADNPALTRGRLSWVQQNYLRADTLTQANARLVDAQTEIPLAQQWGGGEVASADGLRFVVPVRTIHARPTRKYFHVGSGVTYFNFTSDQYTGFHGIVVPGTLRDSLFLLAGLLEQQTSLQPVEIMTDSASYSDVVFGLFWLLGYQFSPRLADIGGTRLWRMDRSADYGPLNGVARHRIRTDLITRNWDDILRIAGSLKLGTVNPVAIMRLLQLREKPTMLARALAELGRIIKSLYLLSYLDDESQRRRVLIQLNRGEGRHSLARAIFHGQRGELRQRYRDGQEDQLGALGLVTNVVVLWNTRYMDAALKHLQHRGIVLDEEDVARLSPLRYHHLNFQGRYYFPPADTRPDGELRPLRIRRGES